MKEIIVTLTDKQESFSLDVEIPVDITIDKLACDISEILIRHGLHLENEKRKTELYHNRRKMLLKDGTADSEGIWNGDYITVC